MRTLRTSAAAVLLLMVPTIASASAGGSEVAHDLGSSTVPMIFHAVNLVLLLGGLGYLLRGRISSALAARADEIKRSIDGAGAAEADANARFAELSARMDNFDNQLAEMRAETEKLAAAEREALLERANREAQSIRATAQRTIRDETARATADLQAEAAKLAIGLAARRVTEQINDEDHQRLDSEFLSVLGVQEVGHG